MRRSKVKQNSIVLRRVAPVTNVAPIDNKKQYFEVYFCRAGKKRSNEEEGYFSFGSTSACSLYNGRGKKRTQNFFVSSLESPTKRLRDCSSGDELFFDPWKVELLQEISLEEFERALEPLNLNKKKFKKKMENLPPLAVDNNIGHLMLQKMGWKEGSGLGKKEDGVTEPIPLLLRDAKKGIGCV